MLKLSQVQLNEKDNWKKKEYVSRAVEKNINHQVPPKLSIASKTSFLIPTNNFLYILKYKDTFVKVAILNIVLNNLCDK